MSEVRRCADHGFHEARDCPICGATGEPIVGTDRRRRLSKFLSGALRHFPGDAGIVLDERGWTSYSSLVETASERYEWADETTVAGIVATDPKGRFEVDGVPVSGTNQGSSEGYGESDGGSIRAAYGHSVAVDLEPTNAPVPDVLFHGTSPEAVSSIFAEGIKPMSRQLVHLSGSVEGAIAVGSRHTSDPVLLEVDAAAMLADGHRITKRGESVYTTEQVPPLYVERAD